MVEGLSDGGKGLDGVSEVRAVSAGEDDVEAVVFDEPGDEEIVVLFNVVDVCAACLAVRHVGVSWVLVFLA